MINVEATRILLEYKADMAQKVLDLRAEACRIAAIVRAIERAISIDDIKELEDWKLVQEAYSLKGIDSIIFNKDK
jgi:hypothetical protein